jgi:3-(3-hydroxy-phenyl)propionate hydroxylase
VIFLGDAAHQVSPFGARGGNGGVQDADNLAWKLAAVLRGEADEALLDSYDAERSPAADENIRHSTRSTDFITPKTRAAHAIRDAVLELAAHHAFARPMVNSGRLSRPALLSASPLNTADDWEGGVPPGAVAEDAPVQRDGAPDWLLAHLRGAFTVLAFDPPTPIAGAVIVTSNPVPGALWDSEGLAYARYAARPGSVVLIRPDQHVAARFRHHDPALIAAARQRALGA